MNYDNMIPNNAEELEQNILNTNLEYEEQHRRNMETYSNQSSTLYSE